MLLHQFEEICEWQEKTFPEATALSKLKHLEKEICEEMIPCLESDPPFVPNVYEYADALFLIYGSAKKCGYSYFDLIQAVQDKFEINKKREWNKPNKDGIYLHKKDE